MDAKRLESACHSARFLLSDLQLLLKSANAIEALLLLDVIEQAAKIEQRVKQIKEAVYAEK